MPSPLLGMAAGVGDPIEHILSRIMEEQVLAQRGRQLEETQRSNMAGEALQGENIRLNSGIRRDAQVNLDRDRQDRLASSRIALRAPGSMMTPEEKVSDRGQAPASSYEFQPENLGATSAGPAPGAPEGSAPPPGEIAPTPTRFEWKGTEEQRHRAAQEQRAGGLQLKTVTYQGKPVEANFDPKTGATTYRGKDITNEAGHYEKPDRPDRVFLQSGDSWIPRTEARSRFNKGQEVPLADTAETRNRAGAIGRVQPMLDAIRELSPVINTKPGIQAVFSGGWRQVKAKAMEDDDVAEYVAVIEAFTPLLARAEGHVGVLTEADFEHSMSILPTPRDSASLAQRKIARLEKILAGAAKGPAQGGDTGVPQVGGTFQGGKVLKVTPIKP